MNISMISISDHPISMMYKREVISSWSDYKVKHFQAVTPKDLYLRHELKFGIKGDREFTETEKAVWYSHYDLWVQCYLSDKPLLIIEHDSKLVKPLPDMSKEGYKLLSYMTRDFGPAKGQRLPSVGSGYYITPQFASRLIVKAITKPATQNSDGFIATTMNWDAQIKKKDYFYIDQVNLDGLNTIDHKNPHRNFIGQDYEDIDLSGVHR
jgi:hypothetical protein